MGNDDKQIPPVTVGDVLDLPVEGVGKGGDPVVRCNNYVLFVKLKSGNKLKIQEAIKIKVTKVLPNFGFAEIHKE